jgi:ribosomal protein S18 acetylase RimI-like enzyme
VSFLGYAIILQKDEVWFLDNIAVSPWAQGRGVGSALIAACEAFLRDRGVQRYHLYTNEVMEQNLTWYPAIGFVETDRRLEDGFSRVYFSKALV